MELFINAAPVACVVASDTRHVGSVDFFPCLGGVGGVEEHSAVTLREYVSQEDKLQHTSFLSNIISCDPFYIFKISFCWKAFKG